MRPVLVELYGYQFHAYVTMLSIAFVAATLLGVRESDKQGLNIPPETGLWIFIAALVGAKAFWIVQYDSPWRIWRSVFIWEGGLVFYGGLIGGLLAAYAYVRLYRIPTLQAADVCAPYLILGQGITRIGCFLNGCCYGRPTILPVGIQFPPGSHVHHRQLVTGLLEQGAQNTLPVHPTQLYMVLGLFGTFVALKIILARKRFHGQVAAGYLLFYGALRFVVEGLRGDSARSIATLTVSQAISLGLMTVGAAIFVIAWRKGWFQRPIITPNKPSSSSK